MEKALNTVIGVPCPSVTVTVWAEAFVLVIITARTHEGVAVSAVLAEGTACRAGVNAVTPQAGVRAVRRAAGAGTPLAGLTAAGGGPGGSQAARSAAGG